MIAPFDSSTPERANRSRVALFVFGHAATRVGGIEMHMCEVIKMLNERGWQAVICFHQQPVESVRTYLSLPNVKWDVLPNAWQNSWQAKKDLARVLRRYRPALLHLQFTPFLGFNAWLARLGGVRRIAFTDHDSRPEGHNFARAPLWKRLVARFLTLPVSAVICVSDYNRRAMRTLGYINNSKLHRIYNGTRLPAPDAMNLAAADFRRRFGIPQDRILVTQVSWLIPQKGILDALEAARKALEVEPSLHFAFVGDGECREEYRRRSVELGIEGNVTWTGVIHNPMSEGVFSATDISCQASRWEEAFGLVIAEAMAFAKPVVATRVGGVPELVLDGETGYLTERGDSAALAQRIVQLARDPDLRERMGKAGRRRAEDEFDVQKNVKILGKIYGLA